MLELPPQVVQALLDVGVSRAEVGAAWSSLSERARHGLGLARRLLERGAATPQQLEQALGSGSSPAPAPRAIGAYRVLRPLGRGGMGEVVLVADAQGRQFALKTLSLIDSPTLIERFRREIHTMGALQHPNLVGIHDAGVHEGTPFLVMQHYPGGTLQGRVTKGPLDPDMARDVATKLADALAAVHASGLVHRDVKPENVLFDDAGEPRLADFGLATAGERSLYGGRLTLSNEVIGTPAYMAPEQALDAKDVGAAADVYALGGVLYAMLTGRPPFTHDGSVVRMLNAVLHEVPSPPDRVVAGVPKDLNDLCLRALAKDPNDRPPSAAAFAAALRGHSPARTAGWVLPLVLAAALAALGALAAVVAFRAPSPAVSSPLPVDTPDPSVPANSPHPLALARAGLPSAAWAAWTLEEDRDAAWLVRGEALLVAGATPSAWDLAALELSARVHSEWLVYLAAREVLSPRPLPEATGGPARLQELVTAEQQLNFAPNDLRAAFVALSRAEQLKLRLVTRVEANTTLLINAVARGRQEFDHDSPLQLDLLHRCASTLAELAIYRWRRLDKDDRLAFSAPVPLDAIYALRSVVPEGQGRVSLEIAKASIDYRKSCDAAPRLRTEHAKRFFSVLEPLCFEQLSELSVQLRVWCLWWLLDCQTYFEALPAKALVAEIVHLQHDMQGVSWQSQGFDGRRFLDEDEFYRRGTAFRLLQRYPRAQPAEAWPRFDDLVAYAERAAGTNVRSFDRVAQGNVHFAAGDLGQVEVLLAQLEPGESHREQALLRAAVKLLLARRVSERERAGHLAAAETLLQSVTSDWTRPHVAAYVDLLCLRGAPDAEIAAAELSWAKAQPCPIAPTPYQLFDPARAHFVAREGAIVIPFPPVR